MVASDSSVLLEVEDLRTYFEIDGRTVRSVDGIGFSVPRGKTVCIVGESGSGKSVTARSILQLIDPPGRIVTGHVWWHGPRPSPEHDRRRGLFRHRVGPRSKASNAAGPLDLAALTPHSETLRRMRGSEISMVFQEPMASLSPMYSVGDHLVEAMRLHINIGRREAWRRGIALLDRVGIARPEDRMRAYSFQLSGGMCQRVMIAIALCCQPSLIIADEPTTALDVTTQERILALLRELRAEHRMSMLFITHDLGVVAEIADEVVVMQRGKVVESGSVDAIFHAPRHDYTRRLLAAMPRMTRFDAVSEAAP